MRKIIVGAQVSMDGVMQAPGGPWEDPTKGFEFGGWVMPYLDQVFGEEIDRVFEEKCDGVAALPWLRRHPKHLLVRLMPLLRWLLTRRMTAPSQMESAAMNSLRAPCGR